ncbi:unnamed protein product [Urochloa decumbens]|uniref:Zinc finger LSD1-type domain-containing protein n=1 Tax=Urochloa decumbens TaxID=240449 RepID=A0ABC8YTI1_9POAL
MAASPGTAEPLESSDTHSSTHPPSCPGLHYTQESPSLITAAPPEMANPDRATPVPLPPAGQQSTAEHLEADQMPPTPIDEAELPPSHLPPPVAAPAAAPAFEAIRTEKVASPSPLPEDVVVEVSPEVAASALSPPSSPYSPIVGASPEDAPQPSSPPRIPPAMIAGISMDPSTIEATAMASQEEAARPSPAPEMMDTGSRTAPAPLMPSPENGTEGLLPQQKPGKRGKGICWSMIFTPQSHLCLKSGKRKDERGSVGVGLRVCENLEPAQPSPPQPCHPAECTDASPDAAVDEVVKGMLEKAAGSLPVPEATDGDSELAPCVHPALEIGPEEVLSQQQLRPPCPEMAPPQGENSKSAKKAAGSLPVPEATDGDSEITPGVHPALEIGPEKVLSQQQLRPPCPEMAPPQGENSKSAEKAAGSLPVPEVTDGDSEITPGVHPALEFGPEEVLSQQQPRPPCPEMAPPQGENSKSARPPQPPPPAESTFGGSNAPTNDVSSVTSEGATAALEIGAERSSLEVQTSTTSRMEAEPCSPEMAPPGFEDFKSQWLPVSPPTPPAESTHNVVQVAAINPVGMTPDASTESLSASEDMGVEMDLPPSLLPPLKSGAEVLSQQPLLRSCSPLIEAAPCSPDMAPPGFENCKSSWLPVPTLPPLCETTYPLPDVSSTKAVTFLETACSVPALEAMDVEADTERGPLPLLESETGCSLQGPLPISPSSTIEATPYSPDTAPPGFKNIKVMHVTSKEASQPSSALEAMDLNMDATPAVAPLSESEAGKSLPLESPLAPSHVAQHTACSLGMVPSGSENVESSQLPPQPAAVLPLDETPDALADAGTKTVTNPLPVTGAAEEANGSILPPALENGCKDPLPHLGPQASSAGVHAAPTSPEIAPTSENPESSQHTSPCLAETIDSSAHASVTMPAIVKSDKTSLLLSPLQATDTNMESATLQQSPLKSEERSLPQPEQHPSSPSVKDTTCSPEVAAPGYENLDSSEELPPPPPLSMKFEMGQMVCGRCRQLLAYPRGSVHVQCFGCWTINLVLEEHQVGKVYCGQCDTLLMYPFGAPAVKCSSCCFITEIRERNVRPRISREQSVSPQPREVAQQN